MHKVYPSCMWFNVVHPGFHTPIYQPHGVMLHHPLGVYRYIPNNKPLLEIVYDWVERMNTT